MMNLIFLAFGLISCLTFQNVFVSSSASSSSSGSSSSNTRSDNNLPNIIFVLTDDQDLILDGMEPLLQTKELIVNKGITFNNAFVTSPICCISRASILTGRYMHNTHTYNNSISGGCSSPTWQSDLEPYTYAVSAQNNGYITYYAGKYLNTYGNNKIGNTSHIPPGWTQWYGLVGNSRYYDYCVSDQGTRRCKNDTYHTDYFTDVIKRQALSFLGNISTNINDTNKPLLMVLATPAAHASFIPAPQYMNTSAGENAPRTPNWNISGELNAHKHELMRQTIPLNNKSATQSDASWRFRHGTLKSVDDMIAAVYSKLEDMGRINNTYWIYTSDHGFHLGQWGMMYDKRQLYEHDVRVPFYISGPGIPENIETDMVALNIDIGPTIVDLATNNVPDYMDGQSLVKFFENKKYYRKKRNNNINKHGSSLSTGILQKFMIEYSGEGGNNGHLTECQGYSGYENTLCDSWNNTYQCVRTIDGTKGEINGTIYCRFICYENGHDIVDCDEGTPESQGEYYEMDNDPYQLTNLWTTLTNDQVNDFESQVTDLLDCSGYTQCNSLRGNETDTDTDTNLGNGNK